MKHRVNERTYVRTRSRLWILTLCQRFNITIPSDHSLIFYTCLDISRPARGVAYPESHSRSCCHWLRPANALCLYFVSPFWPNLIFGRQASLLYRTKLNVHKAQRYRRGDVSTNFSIYGQTRTRDPFNLLLVSRFIPRPSEGLASTPCRKGCKKAKSKKMNK